MATWAIDINTDPCYYRTTDPDMSLGSSLAWTSPWSWMASRVPTNYSSPTYCGPRKQADLQHLSIPHCLHFFLSVCFHSTWTILLLYLSHFSTIYFLIIIRLTCQVPQGARQTHGYLNDSQGVENPNWLVVPVLTEPHKVVLKSFLTSDMDMKSSEFTQFITGLDLVQYFLTMLLSLCFRTPMYILCHYMFEYVICFFILILQMIRVKRFSNSQKRLWTFK